MDVIFIWFSVPYMASTLLVIQVYELWKVTLFHPKSLQKYLNQNKKKQRDIFSTERFSEHRRFIVLKRMQKFLRVDFSLETIWLSVSCMSHREYEAIFA